MEPLPASCHRIIAYDEATRDQVCQAELRLEEDLGAHFPHLEQADWHQAFRRIRPAVRVLDDTAAFTYEGVLRVHTYLTKLHTPESPEHAPAEYGQLTLYLAERLWLSALVARTVQKLPEMQVFSPTSILGCLLEKLATPDKQVQQVLDTLEWSSHPATYPYSLSKEVAPATDEPTC